MPCMYEVLSKSERLFVECGLNIPHNLRIVSCINSSLGRNHINTCKILEISKLLVLLDEK